MLLGGGRRASCITGAAGSSSCKLSGLWLRLEQAWSGRQRRVVQLAACSLLLRAGAGRLARAAVRELARLQNCFRRVVLRWRQLRAAQYWQSWRAYCVAARWQRQLLNTAGGGAGSSRVNDDRNSGRLQAVCEAEVQLQLAAGGVEAAAVERGRHRESSRGGVGGRPLTALSRYTATVDKHTTQQPADMHSRDSEGRGRGEEVPD